MICQRCGEPQMPDYRGQGEDFGLVICWNCDEVVVHVPERGRDDERPRSYQQKVGEKKENEIDVDSETRETLDEVEKGGQMVTSPDRKTVPIFLSETE